MKTKYNRSMVAIESKQKKNVFLWRRALFPAVVSFCAFICFAVVYWMCINTIDTKYLFLGLFFIVPSLVFFYIAYLAGKNKLRDTTTFILSVVLVPILFNCSLSYFISLSMSASSVTVTNVSRYERTMRLGGRSEKEQLAIFPKKIPDNVTDAVFYYNESAWLEYDQTVVLSFSANKEVIDGYAKQFEKSAKKIENANSTNVKDIYGRVGESYIKDLSVDYIIYIIMNEGGRDKKVCAVSINPKKNHIIFYAYETRW